MVLIQSILTALLAVAPATTYASPNPALDDIDLCGPFGLDVELIPQATIDSKFKIRVTKTNFALPYSHLSRDALLTRDDSQFVNASLEDNVLSTEAGKLSYNDDAAGFYAVFTAKGENPPLTVEAVHVCDIITKKHVQILRLKPTDPDTRGMS